MALNYLDDLGIGVEPTTNDVDATNPEDNSDNNQNFVQDSDNPTADGESIENKADTEQPETQMDDAVKNQIEMLEKRLSDKDAYINELREQSKEKQDSKDTGVKENEEEEGFWDNPEETINTLKAQLRMQDIRLSEVTYANTKKDYWDVVNGEAVKQAMAIDETFAEDFNKSTQPYKTAYEYLSKAKQESVSKQDALRQQIRDEIMKELNVTKDSKDTVPSLSKMGGSNNSKNESPTDGFTAMFGNDGYN